VLVAKLLEREAPRVSVRRAAGAQLVVSVVEML
jgi:hypothetical protein